MFETVPHHIAQHRTAGIAVDHRDFFDAAVQPAEKLLEVSLRLVARHIVDIDFHFLRRFKARVILVLQTILPRLNRLLFPIIKQDIPACKNTVHGYSRKTCIFCFEEVKYL